jgi:UDP-GlcNAc:undecaprenyl-phosphate GlcNAc-1-phosphate transferase
MNYLAIFLISFFLSFVFTPVVRKFALKFGLVARPREDRWHKRPTALLGGVGLWLACVVSVFLFFGFDFQVIYLIAASSILFIVGLYDDLKGLSPQVKILGQIVASCIFVFFCKRFSGNPLVIPLSILWLVGVTNSFNLLDNMDGLASGIAAIASSTLFISSRLFGNDDIAVLALILAGANFGFLPYNFNPARIFMGDSGSMFIGFILGALAIMGTSIHISNLMVTLAIPVLILGVPIFDTTFVTLMRMMRGRSILKGGKDHTSHRLVTLGLSETKTVLLLYLLSILFGLIALAYSKVDVFIVSIFVVLILIVLFFFGAFLADVEIRSSNQINAIRKKELKEGKVVLNALILHKRRIVEVIVDFILICLSYYSAYLLRFEGVISSSNLILITRSLPWIVILRLVCFSYFGLYRGMWRYISITDLIAIFKAVSLSSILVVLILTFLFRFENYSRVVFVIDWLLAMFFIAGVRILIRLMGEYFAPLEPEGRRILIVGAGDTGEMVLREIKRNKNLKFKPIGFIDDDITKLGRKIHGIPVLGTRDDISRLVQSEEIEEVFIAIPSAQEKEMESISKICHDCGIVFRKIGAMVRHIE